MKWLDEHVGNCGGTLWGAVSLCVAEEAPHSTSDDGMCVEESAQKRVRFARVQGMQGVGVTGKMAIQV